MSINIVIYRFFKWNVCISLADLGRVAEVATPPPLDGEFYQKGSLLGLQPPPPFRTKNIKWPVYPVHRKLIFAENTKGY